MQFFTVGDSWELRHVLAAFDWTSLDKPGTTVVDIGGGFGTVSQYLARQTSYIHFVVQDLPHVVSMAPTKLPEDLKDRIDFAVHDFHKPQPSEPAPVAFLVRWVLHNWSDKCCINILKNLTPALRSSSNVLIYEYVLEDGPVIDLTGRFGIQMDMTMATLFNAQECTARDFERVLKAADERFVLEGVRRPEGSTMSAVGKKTRGWRGYIMNLKVRDPHTIPRTAKIEMKISPFALTRRLSEQTLAVTPTDGEPEDVEI
jgi:hypothetical protein